MHVLVIWASPVTCLCPLHTFLLSFLVCLPVGCSTVSNEDSLQQRSQSRSVLWGGVVRLAPVISI